MSLPERGCQLVLCGLGGQGIVFLSRVVAEAALLAGEEVLTAETHGMSQRGGAVEAHVKRGDFRCSLVRPGSADVVLVLDASRIPAALPFVASGGAVFANAAAPAAGVRTFDASRVARSLGQARAANLALLGHAAREEPGLFPVRDALVSALDRLSPDALRASNRHAFASGADLA